MRKLVYVFLSLIINYSNLQAQSIEGNFELDSLVVEYTIVSRDINQMGNDGNMHTTTYDDSAASYEVTIGWPGAGEDALFEFSLPYWDVGDTMAVTSVPLPSLAALQNFGLGLNVDFTDGAYTVNEGSVYPTTDTEDCVTSQVFLPIQDQGVWDNGGHDPILLPGNKVKWGWAIIESGIFANFKAPNMATDVFGVDYGAGTDMENWGYFQANYTDDTYSTIDGLNIGWEAHDGVEADLGVVSDGDPFYVQAEADLGLMNGMLGRSALPVDSVTIPGVAAQAAAAGITIHVPELMPYAVGATGIPGTEADPVIGDTTSDVFYIFDPTGDVLGGGDGIAFSGDEGLRFTGYYATWNTLLTLNGITDGLGAAQMGGALANPTAPDVPMLVDSVLIYTLGYWDMSEATTTLIIESVTTDAITTVTSLLTAGLSPTEIGMALLPYVLEKVTGLQADNSLTHSNGDAVVVNDSWQDLDFNEFSEEIYYATGNLVNHTGGRIWAAMDPICFPAKWTQRVDSHWSYMGALSTVNDNNITVDRFELKGNYPNPFNPTTKIRFTNDRSSNVKVTVYSLNGKKVATIMNRQVNAGAYDVSWNGKNSNGTIVPTGMYLYDIESDGRRLQGKMLFLK